MDSDKFYEAAKLAFEIASASKNKGLTLYKFQALVELDKRPVNQSELQKLIQIENIGQFSRDVVVSLRSNGYIQKTKPGTPLLISNKGRKVVRDIKGKLGY